MAAIWDWFRWLYDAHGINLPFLYDAYDRSRFLRGMGMTLWLSLVTIVLSIVIGVIGAWGQSTTLRPLRALVQGYVQLFRNTPPLVQLYFFYFALGPLLPRVPNQFGVPQPIFGSFAWAVVSLSLFAGAFNVEIFRSGVEAVPRTMLEAADSLGYRRLQVYRYVVLPLAVRVCLPALNNNLVNLIKTTTLAYAIAVPEVLFVSSQIWSDSINVLEMMVTLFIFFMVVVGGFVRLMSGLERLLKVPGFGQ